MSIFLDEKTWQLIKAISNSLSISEAARKAGIPKATVWRKINNLFSKTRVRFIVSARALGLRPLVVFFEEKPTQLPNYTISFRKALVSGKPMYMVIGLVPEKYITDYLFLFDKDPTLFLEYEDKIIWRPHLTEKYNAVTFFKNTFMLNYNIIRELIGVPEKKSAKSLDIYDLYIIAWKENYAFTPLTEIYMHALEDNIKASRQLFSYHFRNHVIPLWIGNAVMLYKSMKDYPLRVFVYECENAEELAFKLSLIPYIYTVYYSRDRIFFVGQPSQKEIYELYSKLLSDYKPSPLICETYLEPSLMRFVVKYYKLWNKGWKRPIVAYKIKAKT